MEWYHVWWPWLTFKRVARVCQHQLSFLLTHMLNSTLVVFVLTKTTPERLARTGKVRNRIAQTDPNAIRNHRSPMQYWVQTEQACGAEVSCDDGVRLSVKRTTAGLQQHSPVTQLWKWSTQYSIFHVLLYGPLRFPTIRSHTHTHVPLSPSSIIYLFIMKFVLKVQYKKIQCKKYSSIHRRKNTMKSIKRNGKIKSDKS